MFKKGEKQLQCHFLHICWWTAHVDRFIKLWLTLHHRKLLSNSPSSVKHTQTLVSVKANWSGLIKFLHNYSWKRSENWSNHLRSCGWRGSEKSRLTAERILAIVDSIAQLLQHHVEGRVLRQLDHEHAGLHANVTQIWWTWNRWKHRVNSFRTILN